MFDEMFPGMGMMGMYGMNPMTMGINPAMFGGMQQYRQPGADIFSSMGIMNPQQQMFQQVEMRNMLEQQQFAREQQMLAMRNMSMNMGANAAQIGSGFAGPMLMGMGGLQNGQIAKGVTGLADALISKFGPQNGGMTPMGPQAAASQASQIDPTQIIAAARAKYPDDPGRAYTEAGQQLIQLGKASGNDALIQGGVRTMDQGNKFRLANAQTEANTAKSAAQAAEANARVKSLQVSMNMPKTVGTVRNSAGWQGLQYAQRGPDGQIHMYTTGWGPNLTYASPGTPGGWQKNGDSFQKYTETNSTAINRINSLESQVKNGAPIGWAQDATSFFNDVLGTLKQLTPGDSNIPDSVRSDFEKNFPTTFQSWATKGEIGESTAQDLVMSLASTYAAGRQVSRTDIARAESVVGTATSNPQTLIPLLENVKQRTIGDVDRTAQFYLAGGEGNAQYSQRIKGLQQTFHSTISAPSVNAGTTTDLGNGWTVTQH